MQAPHCRRSCKQATGKPSGHYPGHSGIGLTFSVKQLDAVCRHSSISGHEPVLLYPTEALRHHRRLHSGNGVCDAHCGWRRCHRHRAEPVDSDDDIPSHTVSLVCKTTRRRADHERDRHGSKEKHLTLQPYVHQPSHNHHRRCDACMLHNVYSVA